MKRRGKCRRCGRCCQTKTLAGLNNQDAANFKFLFGNDVNELNCPHLGFIDKTAYCLNYENRPWFCREYPGEPGDLIDDKCGFKFVPP